jgi:ribonuclease E
VAVVSSIAVEAVEQVAVKPQVVEAETAKADLAAEEPRHAPVIKEQANAPAILASAPVPASFNLPVLPPIPMREVATEAAEVAESKVADEPKVEVPAVPAETVTVTVPHDVTLVANESNVATPITESVSIVAAETTHAEPANEPVADTHTAAPVVVTPAPLFHQPEQGDLLSQPMRQHAAAAPEHGHEEKAKEPSPEEGDLHQAQHNNHLS